MALSFTQRFFLSPSLLLLLLLIALSSSSLTGKFLIWIGVCGIIFLQFREKKIKSFFVNIWLQRVVSILKRSILVGTFFRLKKVCNFLLCYFCLFISFSLPMQQPNKPLSYCRIWSHSSLLMWHLSNFRFLEVVLSLLILSSTLLHFLPILFCRSFILP